MEMFVEWGMPLLTGAVISFIIHLTGIGGGVILIPALTIIFGMDIPLAVGTGSLYLVLSRIFSCADHALQKNIALTISCYFLLGAIPGITMVGFCITYLLSVLNPNEVVLFKTGLEYFTIGIIFLSIGMLLNQRFKFIKSKTENTRKKTSLKLLIPGIIIGGIMAATGIGGGVLVVPILMKYTNLNTKKIVGSSIFIALLISLATFLIYAKDGLMSYKISILMTVGSLISMPIGGLVVRRLTDKSIENMVIILIICSAFYMLLF